MSISQTMTTEQMSFPKHHTFMQVNTSLNGGVDGMFSSRACFHRQVGLALMQDPT
jgi:hypothetical protein